MATKNITITGRVLNNQTKAGIPDLKVEAWDKDTLIDDMVGNSQTDSNGAFSIVFTRKYFKELFLDQKPDLYFKVYLDDRLIASTENDVLWNIDSDQTDIEILIDMQAKDETEPKDPRSSFMVKGKVSNRNKNPLKGLLVKAFNIDMRSETLLGECLTDAKGFYKITYRGAQHGRAEKGSADLCMRVYYNDEVIFNTRIDDVIFNASKNETVNMVIEARIKPKNNEFDSILQTISGLIGQVAIEDLQENATHRDITFLNKETNIQTESLEYIVVAHRLSKLSKIDAAFFYALLRENTLLKTDVSKALRSRMSISMNTEIKPLLYDAALTDPEIVKKDVETAVKELVVSEKVGKELKKTIEALSQFKQEAESYYAQEYPQKFINVIGKFVTDDMLGEIAQIYQENKSDLGAFFNKITDPSFFSSDTKAEDAKTNIALGEILGFDDEIISQISGSLKIKSEDEIKKLASLNKAGWVNELTKASEKIEVAGKKLDKNLISLHASSLVRKMEKQFPTVAFAAQLGRESKTVFQQQEKLKTFFAKNEAFDLQHDNVDAFLYEKEGAKADEAVRNELKSVQRIFKLVPHYGKTNALRSQKIHSAQSIVAAGKSRFVKDIAPKAGIEKAEAKEIFQKAERKHTAAMLILGELQDTMSAMNIPAMEMRTLSTKLEAVSKDFPNLKSLFQLTDVCACEHCRSVYSPAAYLVEILQFLSQRLVSDLTDASDGSSNLAKDILFTRRPDLGEIDLSCENANTPLPYIDLVCELLEEAVSPDAGVDFTGTVSAGIISATLLAALPAEWSVTDKAVIYETETASGGSAATLPHYLRDKKAVCRIENTGVNTWNIKRLRQTLSPAEELAAAPDYVNQDAYTELNSISNAFAFKLPFDLNHAEASAYFDRFGFSRADLMRNFIVSGTPADLTIAAETLGLTEVETNLIMTADTANQNIYWNTTASDAVSEMKIVDTFLTKSGLTYIELDLLLELEFIDPDDNLFIQHEDLSCDTEKKEIANLDAAALDRMHRFLRLQKKTKWKFETLNDIINQGKLGNKVLDDKCLIKAAALVRLSTETSIKIEDLPGFYGEIPYTEYLNPTKKPLYHQVFLNKAKNGFIDENLQPEKVDGPVIHPAVIQLLADVKSSLVVCLRMKEKDLDLLLALLPDGNLSFSNLSTLFCQSVLIRKLKLKAEDFLILKDLINLDFQASPEKTLEFAEAVGKAKNSPLKASLMEFQLAHPLGYETLEISDDKITTLLKTLQAAYQKSYDTTLSTFDPLATSESQKEKVQSALGGLSLLNEADVKILINFIDATWEYSWTDSEYVVHTGTVVADATTFITDKKLSSQIDTAQIIAAINALPAAKTASETADTNEATALAALDAANEALAADPSNAALIAAQATAATAEATTLAAATTAAASLESAKNALIKAYLDAVSEFQYATEKQNTLLQTISTSFKVSTDTATVVLANAELKQPVAGTLVRDYLLSDTFIDTSTPVTLPVIDATTFTNQYLSLRLLHKLFPLLASFDLKDDETEFLLANAKDLGWFEPDAIPYQAGQSPVTLDSYIALCEMLAYAQQFPAVENPSDPENPLSFWSLMEMLLTGSTTLTAEWLDALALMTGYELDDLTEIDSYFGFSSGNLHDYRSNETWKTLIDSTEYLRTLGLPLSTVTTFIDTSLTSDEASQLRAALKVRYDDILWLETLKEIMNVVRAKKRNALVAYLLAKNPEMLDENYLYDYFLVDVEMEACMPSSRIVLAHGSVQLFVTRCLMGLEPQAAADLDNDASWTQWKWMKNYRVWEANRKVFLYPENWIEAELRDDKSFLFTELENELLQNELNEFTAEEALIRYLEKLDNIAFLEVVATWYQTDIRTMHVFARTKGGDPAIYYYRTFEKEFYWTPWEKVELDISGSPLMAFVRNNRLCLTWAVFSEEPNPDPEATLPDQTDTGPQAIDKPSRKLKIQIAVSEFANEKWQPKKVSVDAITTPSYYTTNDLPRDIYSLAYNEIGDQIVLFSTSLDVGHQSGDYYSPDHETHSIIGAFNVTGCKGYPELEPNFNSHFPDFLPDFKQSLLKSQRYYEQAYVPDDLAVRNGITYILSQEYLELLKKTPGYFRLTYPHQLTIIDIASFFAQYLMIFINGQQGGEIKSDSPRSSIKIPLGTLLPYFMEDSKHAYVIVPGFYRKQKEKKDDKKSGDELLVQRTASNMIQLLEDIVSWINKLQVYLSAPTPELLSSLLKDFQTIMGEIKILGKLKYGEKFSNMYHPLVCSLRTILYKDGIEELMKRDTQLKTTSFDFNTRYEPVPAVVPKAYSVDNAGIKKFVYPIEDLDFSSDGSYSGYNWELFFHVPLLIATRLTKNQKFEEALTWFHYMFNPTGALPGEAPEKYWVTKPFYQTHTQDYIDQRIDTLLNKIADPTTPEIADLEKAIDEWREDPFKPHVVARFRPVAYQKALLMKYIDNLTEWGDYLFRQDTMESIVQATQMYILADKLLGPKPRIIPALVKPPYETYNQLEAKMDAFGNALNDLENILPDLSSLPEEGAELPSPPATLSMLYFCIPPNEKMNEYWDRVADRLFKIRHCQNIDGVERSLALFAPPIDPGMLVKAAAAGLDISSVIAGMNAPLPFYRFQVLSQKANELVQEVRNLGSSLLAALEKKDGEAMALLRSELEIKMLNAVTDMKLLQIKEAKEQIEILKKTQKVTEERHKYYSTIEKINSKEQLSLDKLDEAHNFQTAAQGVKLAVSIISLLPDINLGASGFGGSPVAEFKIGGINLGQATNAASDILSFLGMLASNESSRASILGGYNRRFDDWKLQERLAKKELASIEKQIAAAEIRKEISETDLKNHKLQIENAKKSEDFMKSKFTNKQLYEWMIGQISSVYFRSYQLAHDFAKKAERCYQHELGNTDTFIQYGYWDSLKKGLQSADQLVHDIKRMETSYLNKNKREYELTKHVSLVMLDPLALIKLKATGSCDFEIPEAVFDMDHAGHYFRRLKSVSITLPCIAGPYTSVSAKLSLVSNRYRKDTSDAGSGYPEDPGNDTRFIYNVGAIQSIAASNGQNDSGIFELNFRDERYLPFEGTGAISTWRLELPAEVRQFDYNTISDVLLHLKYTAREGGSSLKTLASDALLTSLDAVKQQLSQTGLHHAINMKYDMPNEWYMLKKNGTVSLVIDKFRLPYFVQALGDDLDIESVTVIANVNADPKPSTFAITLGTNSTLLNKLTSLGDLCLKTVSAVFELDVPINVTVDTGDMETLDELMLVVKYTLTV